MKVMIRLNAVESNLFDQFVRHVNQDSPSPMSHDIVAKQVLLAMVSRMVESVNGQPIMREVSDGTTNDSAASGETSQSSAANSSALADT
jgi:hypothetical protein